MDKRRGPLLTRPSHQSIKCSKYLVITCALAWSRVELPRFGGHMIVLVSDSVFPDCIDLTPQRSLPPPGGRSSGAMLLIAHAPARS